MPDTESWNVKDFAVHMSSTSVMPGQMVTGIVMFTVTSEMSFRNVTFKLIGREFTHAHVQSTTQRRNFFKVHVTPLGMPKWGGNWQGTLAAGTYSFPFAFRLPVDVLPSVTQFAHSNESAVKMKGANDYNHAAVQYYVKARIEVPFKIYTPIVTARTNHTYDTPQNEKITTFAVTTAIPFEQSIRSFSLTSPLTTSSRKSCCFDKGTTACTVSLDKTVVVLGDILAGHITINNANSAADVDEVVILLERQIVFSANGHACVASMTISQVPITVNVKAKQPGDQIIPFQLLFGQKNQQNMPGSFKGELMSLEYMISFLCDEEPLSGKVRVMAASSVDASNTSPPVQMDTAAGKTIPKGMYPRFLYAPPPGSMPQLPPQKANIGPFPCQAPFELEVIPY